MIENEMKSEKITLKKYFIIVWFALIIILICNIVINIFFYLPYKKGQDTAVSLIIAVDIEGNNQNDYVKKFAKNRKATIEEMYEDLDYDYVYFSYLLTSEQKERLIELKKQIIYNYDAMMEKKHYEDGILHYLRYKDFFEYYLEYSFYNELFRIIFVALLLIVGGANLFYLIDRKTQITLNNETLICKKRNGKTKQAFWKDIKTVENTTLKGLCIKGTSFKYKIILLKNLDELKNEMISLISNASVVVSPANEKSDNLDDLKKFKDLLISGVITQEEFEAKKKQILGL